MTQTAIFDSSQANPKEMTACRATIGRLAGGVAHEIRNPLAILRMGLDNIAKSLPEKPERAQAFLPDVYEAVSRMQNIVAELLKFGAPAPPAVEDVSLEKLVEEAVSALRGRIESQQVSYTYRAEPGVPDTVHIDPRSIQEVLTILITNALDAMPTGGALSIRTVTATGERKGIKLEVADTGAGVPQEIQHQVFEPFFTTRRGQLGLGLPVAATVLRLHDGRLQIRNQEQGGVCAEVFLPC